MGEGMNQRPISRSEYDQLTPMLQGYVTYTQGQWNPAIPNRNPYYERTKEWQAFQRGENLAALDVQGYGG